MSETISVDESLVQRLPLPLAKLVRRAQNAKTPLDRHQAAYYLWEAAPQAARLRRRRRIRRARRP